MVHFFNGKYYKEANCSYFHIITLLSKASIGRTSFSLREILQICRMKGKNNPALTLVPHIPQPFPHLFRSFIKCHRGID